jgi:hypothetical protein
MASNIKETIFIVDSLPTDDRGGGCRRHGKRQGTPANLASGAEGKVA